MRNECDNMCAELVMGSLLDVLGGSVNFCCHAHSCSAAFFSTSENSESLPREKKKLLFYLRCKKLRLKLNHVSVGNGALFIEESYYEKQKCSWIFQ